jgi:hypothetical protein
VRTINKKEEKKRVRNRRKKLKNIKCEIRQKRKPLKWYFHRSVIGIKKYTNSDIFSSHNKKERNSENKEGGGRRVDHRPKKK